MDAIFLDTNSIHNKKTDSFFGNQSKFQRVMNQVNIIIPSIVILEIKRQKRRYLIDELEKLEKNYFYDYLNLNKDKSDEIRNFIDTKVNSLYDKANDEILHIEYDLTEDDAFEKVKHFAVENIAPFDAKSDKGFKDSCFYFTVKQYQKSNTDKIFVVTNDKRLKEAFSDDKITVIENIEEYSVYYRDNYFKGDYFIGKLREYFEKDSIESNNIVEVSLNAEADWLIKIDNKDEEITLLVDFNSKEILDVVNA